MHRSTSTTRRACALGTTFALIGLTTGLGVFTSTAAYAADETPTAAVAQADPTPTDQPTDTPTDQPTDASSTPAATEPPATDPTTPTDADSSAPAPTGDPTAPADSAPNATQSRATASPTAADVPAPSYKVTIVGKPTVGTTLRADVTGITGQYGYDWTVDGATLSTEPSFTLTKDQIGKKVTLTVTGSTPEQTAEATTDVVTEDVVSADETTADTPLALTVTAGQALSRSFAVKAGSGDVTYSVGFADPDYVADPTDPTDTPDLPDDVTLDPTTGLLSGKPTLAGTYDFTVIATNGTSTTTEYVEVVVDPAAAVGVMAYATDTASSEFFDSLDDEGNPHLDHPISSWIIEPDGTIITLKQPADFNQDPTFTEGGNPTVKQGGSLWISGSAVDEFGNDTVQQDDDGNLPQPTVTSDIASDQISFDEDEFATRVTFPHASTHHLTVAQDGLAVAFPVTVIPTATTVVATTPVGTKGELAYTGTDATDALPWALGFVAAGAGLLGAAAVRRRRAQR
ncbi:hypothetical protein ACTJKO_12785 [Curtobacterium sp. 22159]|uniref:hypothetical protein n=1 Tax=Curtobacterium sp. 22159 TaxID=3453882 RepID=UPI003F83E569